MSSLMVSPHSLYPGCSSGSCWISPGLCPQPGDGQTPCWAPAASSAEAHWTAAATRPAPSTACPSQSGTPAPVTVTMVTNKLQVIFTALHSACPHLSICVCEHAWVRACHVHAECVSVRLCVCLHCYERIFDSKPQTYQEINQQILLVSHSTWQWQKLAFASTLIIHWKQKLHQDPNGVSWCLYRKSFITHWHTFDIFGTPFCLLLW